MYSDHVKHLREFWLSPRVAKFSPDARIEEPGNSSPPTPAYPVNLSTLGADLAELIYIFNHFYFDSGSLTIIQGMFSEDVPSCRGSLNHHFFYKGASPVPLSFSIVRVLNTHGKLGRLQFRGCVLRLIGTHWSMSAA